MEDDFNQCHSKSMQSKKRKSFGRMQDVAKKIRLCTHEIGADCKCLRLECFKEITLEERKVLISRFNDMKTYDEQSLYLCGLITCQPVA